MTDAGDVLAPGTRLDGLEIQEVLGAGGFGITYLARDLSLDVWRAVKEYLPRNSGTRRGDGTVGPRTGSDIEDYRWGLVRFLEEARILARFDHPHLVRVYRVFELRGTAYMVMEYVEGRTLEEELEASGPLSERRVRELLAKLMEGLEEVHEAEVWHRDIKPKNVMVRADGTPVLIDFGAARQAMGGHSGALTAVLTPGYAPVEQYRTHGHQGPWTDIYALGAVAYWALSGEVPEEALGRVEADRLLPVAQAARVRVSARLAAAVDGALAVYAADRPQDLKEWRALLERSVGPSVPPAGAERRVGSETASRRSGQESEQRRWWGVVVAGLAVAALVVALVILQKPIAPERNPATTETVLDKSAAGTNGTPGAVDGGGDRADQTKSIVLVDDRNDSAATEAALDLDRAAQRAIQEGLAAAGFDPGGVDGRFGPGTRAALRDWQRKQGVAATGYLTDSSAAQLQAAGEASLAPRAEPASARSAAVLEGSALLVVETTPPGAEVRVDGTQVGETPLERSDIRAGVREVTLRHPHYETVRIPDRNFEDGVVLRVERILTRGVGRLTVTATPREAWVEVDGERLAERTPVTLEGLPAGPVEVRLGAPEHRPVGIEVVIPKDGLARLERALERIPYGSLTLELEPTDATVTLPDVELSYEPGVRLPEGSHRVVVRSEGYQEAVQRVDVSGATRVRIALQIPYGSLTLELEPPDATVTLPDVELRYQPGVLLPEGAHRVVVRSEGYHEAVQQVDVSGATRVRIALQRQVRERLPYEPEMVEIPGGSFRMGARYLDRTSPVHDVRVESFELGTYEVTFEEYGRFTAATGHRPADDEGWGRGRRPVINVSWKDAMAYTKWLSEQTGERYRLPSEAEWEYAARAGSVTTYSWGNESGRNRANCHGCGSQWDNKQTAPVGSFGPNGWGLHDMHGNVKEWVQDCWNESYWGAPADGSAWESGDCLWRVLRGGSWRIIPFGMRSTGRDHSPASFFSIDTSGFRVARTITP